MAAQQHGDVGEDLLERARRELLAEGLQPIECAGGACHMDGWHRNETSTVIWCVQGSMLLATSSGDRRMAAGDRIELPAGEAFAATPTREGCVYFEAAR